MPKTISSPARMTGTYAGPGRWSEPKGNWRLCQTAMTPMTTRAAPATRSVVSIATSALPGALHLADLGHHPGQLARVGVPERVELVGVHVRDRGVEPRVRVDDL